MLLRMAAAPYYTSSYQLHESTTSTHPRYACAMVAALVVHLGVLVTMTTSCQFPDFVQSRRHNANRREWRRYVTSDSRESLAVTFHANVMQSVYISTNRTISRECISEISNGSFLSTHKIGAEELIYYVCMRFLLRSDNAVQIMYSHLGDTEDPHLCSEWLMTLDHWPLVDRVSFFSNYERCPLEGGFNVRIFDNAANKGICDNFTGETRLESECMAGEGVFFRFRYGRCVPHGLDMAANQHLYCMASWQDGAFTFTVLRHTTAERAWCFRFPTLGGYEFLGQLFHDVHCDRLADISLAIQRDRSPSMTSLCTDDYEACSYWPSPCSRAGSLTRLTCSKLCGVCDNTRPSSCALPRRAHGSWLDVSHTDINTTTILITNKVIQVSDWEEFHCIKWNRPRLTLATIVVERMLVTTFQNGCRPRYTCVTLRQNSDSVLRIKFSQPQVWPFNLTDGQTIDCRRFSYRDDDEPLGARYRSRHYKTLIAARSRAYTNCRLGDTRRFNVTHDDGSTCSGWLTQEGQKTRNKITMMFDGCRGYRTETQFACLDVLRHGPLSDVIVVTETSREVNQFSCWLFPPGPAFYLIAMADCNEAASDRLTNGHIKPLAIFRQTLPVTTYPNTRPPIVEATPTSKVTTYPENQRLETPRSKRRRKYDNALSSGIVRCNASFRLAVFLLISLIIVT